MFPSRLVTFLFVASGLSLQVSQVGLSAQIPPAPQQVRQDMSLRDLGTEPPFHPAPGEPLPQRVGRITQRIDRDHMEVRVFQNGRPIKLFPQFHELIAASPADHRVGLDQVAGKGVALVPSEKVADQWDIYIGVGGVAELCLAGNIFVVKQVLISSRKNPIEVRVDGHIHRLKPGQALLVV